MITVVTVAQGGTYAVTGQRVIDGAAGVPGVDFNVQSQIRTDRDPGRLLATCDVAYDADARSFTLVLPAERTFTLPTGRHRTNVLYVLPDGTVDESPVWYVDVLPLTTAAP